MTLLPKSFCDNPNLHAYLLICSDTDKCNATLLEMAKALMCRHKDEKTAEPCEKCSDCIKNSAGTHPDLFHIGRDGAKVSVDDIRELSTQAYLSTNEAQYKVFMLCGIDKYNPESQNALLKILEEPPKHVRFLLSAPTPFGVLPTVRSRLCTVYASGLGQKELYSALKKLHPDAEEKLLRRMTAYALRYEASDINSMDEKLFGAAFELSLGYFCGERPDAILDFPKGKDKRQEAAVYLQVFLQTLHEIMYTRLTGQGENPDLAFSGDELSMCTGRMSTKRACVLYDALEKALINALSTLNLNINSVLAELSGVL